MYRQRGFELKFPSQKRLLSSQDFQKALQSTIKVRSPHCTLHVAINSQAQARLGMIVAKKRVPTAVARNQIKRIIRESFREQDGLSGIDIVVIIYPSFADLSKQAQRQHLDGQWERLVRLCKKWRLG